MSTSVKFFHSGMTGAPTVLVGHSSGQAGEWRQVFTACLVNGFNERSVTSISVASEVATVTTSTAHGYVNQQVLLISGATPAGLNGEKRATVISDTTFQFAAVGVPDGNATGTMLVRVAPAGWDEMYTDSLRKSVYRSKDPSCPFYFWLQSDARSSNFAYNVRVHGFESMTGLDVGEGRFPSVAQGDNIIAYFAHNITSGPDSWFIVSDGRTVYVRGGGHVYSSESGFLYGFGRFKSFKAADGFNAFVSGANTPAVSSFSEARGLSKMVLGGDAASQWIPRPYNNIGSAAAVTRVVESYLTTSAMSGGAAQTVTGPLYPNPINNGLVLSRTVLAEPSFGLRGVLPGFYNVLHNAHASFTSGTLIDGQGDLTGRKLMALRGNTNNAGTNTSLNFIDITGPWE
jgi:hypothetical protein